MYCILPLFIFKQEACQDYRYIEVFHAIIATYCITITYNTLEVLSEKDLKKRSEAKWDCPWGISSMEIDYQDYMALLHTVSIAQGILVHVPICPT